MATMEDFDPETIATSLIEQINSGDLKHMILQEDGRAPDSISSDRRESMRASVKRMFDDKRNE